MSVIDKINYAPIIVFAYNRPNHLSHTLEALSKNYLASESDLHIYCDGPKPNKDSDVAAVNEVREVLNTIKGFKSIKIHNHSGQNIGLANSVIRGVSEIIGQFKKAIILEDDLVSTPDFLTFMNESLDFYEKDTRIFSVSGYLYPIEIPKGYLDDVIIIPRASSYGWGTWANRWEMADWEVADYEEFIQNEQQKKAFCLAGNDLLPMLKKQKKGMIDSWAIRWTFTHFKNNAYCLHPIISKINDIGRDGSGTHLPNSKKYDSFVEEKQIKLTKDYRLNDDIMKALRKKYSVSLFRKAINKYLYKI